MIKSTSRSLQLIFRIVPIGVCLATLASCTHTVKVEPIEVKPIDITLHIYLEADQKLNDFFSDVENPSKSPDQSKGTK